MLKFHLLTFVESSRAASLKASYTNLIIFRYLRDFIKWIDFDMPLARVKDSRKTQNLGLGQKRD